MIALVIISWLAFVAATVYATSCHYQITYLRSQVDSERQGRLADISLARGRDDERLSEISGLYSLLREYSAGTVTTAKDIVAQLGDTFAKVFNPPQQADLQQAELQAAISAMAAPTQMELGLDGKPSYPETEFDPWMGDGGISLPDDFTGIPEEPTRAGWVNDG